MANMFLSRLKHSDVKVDHLTVTTMPTKTAYSINDTLDLTGMVITATFIDGVTADVTSVVTTTPADGATLSTEGTQAVTVEYGKATVSFNVTVTAIPAWDSRGLEYNSWATIQAYIAAGEFANVAAVGDTKTITLTTNEQLTLKVASINDGTGSAGTYYPANTVDFISEEVMADSHRFNATTTNVGGWNSSEMRTYLNETVYPTLPSDLKNIVINKTHMRTQGDYSTTLVSADDKLWLPTEWEVFGAATYGSETSNYNKHYSIFSNTNSRIKYKKAAPTTAAYWWLSSPATGGSTGFCLVRTDGSAYFNGASGSGEVALGLRIG